MKVVQEKNISGGSNPSLSAAIFDVTTLASGTYIVKILSEVTVPRSIKIVVQH